MSERCKVCCAELSQCGTQSIVGIESIYYFFLHNYPSYILGTILATPYYFAGNPQNTFNAKS